jgi:hypothetical protein
MSLGWPGFSQRRRRSIQLVARSNFVVGRQSQTKAVTFEPREHMEVNVKDILSCRCTVRKKQIDSLAP